MTTKNTAWAAVSARIAATVLALTLPAFSALADSGQTGSTTTTTTTTTPAPGTVTPHRIGNTGIE